jgi:hypothetical protein
MTMTTTTMMTTTHDVSMFPPNEKYIVATNKSIGILAFQLSANIFLGLFHCDVHEAIKTSEHTCD